MQILLLISKNDNDHYSFKDLALTFTGFLLIGHLSFYLSRECLKHCIVLLIQILMAL